MSKSDEYRRFATECLNIGQATEDEQQRAIFLQMARAWLALAQRDEANADQGDEANADRRQCLEDEIN